MPETDDPVEESKEARAAQVEEYKESVIRALEKLIADIRAGKVFTAGGDEDAT